MRHLRLPWMVGFGVLLLILAGCINSAGEARVEPPYTYTMQAGAIILQGFRTGGIAPAPASEIVPRWSLYGDGTLIFQTDNNTLRQAHLSQKQIEEILKEVIEEKQIFASTRQDYFNHHVADGYNWILHIKANGHELVVGASDPASDDAQGKRLTEIVHYLEGYARSLSGTQAYIATDMALTAWEATGIVSLGDTQSWPYPAISLAEITSRTCPQARNCFSPKQVAAFSRSALSGIPIMERGFFTQNKRAYNVWVWPLMPDALYPPPGKSSVVSMVNSTDIAIQEIPLLRMGK